MADEYATPEPTPEDAYQIAERIIEEAAREGATKLNLDNMGLTELPNELFELTAITELNLIDNQLIALPPEIGQLTALNRLDLYRNQLTALPPEIGDLSALTVLYLGRNQLTTLPPKMGNLTALTRLSIFDNQLTALPPEIRQLEKLKRLNLRGNPLPIPPEILEMYEPQTILNYYFETALAPTRPLNEAKMVLLGQGSVGKTSLVNRLLHDTYNPNENKTEGINITEWSVQAGEDDIRLNVWDFGGQEIMHATHQFFLTRRTLYLLALDARIGEEENRLEYWLKIIENFGGDSPVIVVGNKSDQQALDIDQTGLTNKYPQIKAILSTSCQNGEGIPELRAAIQAEVDAMPHVRDEFPKTWDTVKDQLATMGEDFIEYSGYLKMCEEAGVTDETSQNTLIGFLHDLGIVLNFQDPRYPDLGETPILNPEWVTKGVYQILNSSRLLDMGGLLDWSTLRLILLRPAYPRDQHRQFIMGMMRKFELCYSFHDGEREQFLVPDLLRKEEVYTGDWEGSLAFEYHYDVLPGSLLARFIVRMNELINQKTYWRSGVVLKQGQNLALVKADRADRVIRIQVQGRETTRRDFMAVIRATVDALNATIPNLKVDAKVPIRPDVLVDYDHLLTLERKGRQTFIPSGMEDEVSVKALLDGYESQEERQKRAESPHERPQPAQPPQPAPKPPKDNPWISGSFYLVAALTFMVAYSVISKNLEWQAVPIVIIGGLLTVIVIGLFQLRQDDKLKDESFTDLLKETIKQIPLISKLIPDKDKPTLSSPDTGGKDAD